MNPSLNINDLFFQATSTITGGIVTDLTTCLLAMVGLFFLFLGFDLLTDSVNALTAQRCRGMLENQAQKDLAVMNDERIDKLGRDVARSRYGKTVSELGRIKGCGK